MTFPDSLVEIFDNLVVTGNIVMADNSKLQAKGCVVWDCIEQIPFSLEQRLKSFSNVDGYRIEGDLELSCGQKINVFGDVYVGGLIDYQYKNCSVVAGSAVSVKMRI